MQHIVHRGESLWTIAAKTLGDAKRWTDIAQLNHLQHPNLLLIGQRLRLPSTAVAIQPGPSLAHYGAAFHGHLPFEQRPAVHIPARALFFVLADEVNPFRRKLVRKVVFPRGLENPELLQRILHPDQHGFHPRDPASNVSLGRHVLGRTDSKFVSASERPLGSPRFQGKRYFIDVEKTKASGAVIHDGHAITSDLDRIASKSKDPKFKSYIEDIRQKATIVDREVLVEGHIPAGAIKGMGGMAVTRGLQVVEGVGVVMTFYDLGSAGVQSYQQKSIVPLAKESVRQAGGWGAAWAGAEIGGLTGAAFGIETGPGAIITGAIGGFIGGVAGFMGADWVVSRMGN